MLRGDNAMITLAPALPSLSPLAPSPRCALAFQQPPPRPSLHRVLQSRPLRILAACAAHILPPPRLELRIDVHQPPQSIAAELEALHGRLHTPGDALHQCTRLPSPFPDLVLHHREADGEHYIYVEDPARARLAGYTVFNRLIEVDRRTDRHVRAPHSKYAPDYQGRGIATAIYELALDGLEGLTGLDTGFCLVSGARQSVGAHALWQALGRRHPLRYVALHQKRMHELGPEASAAAREDLNTRMILLGRGWSLTRLRTQGLLHGAIEAANGAMRWRA
jgi:GNAT superfamily N-acetyltransferase